MSNSLLQSWLRLPDGERHDLNGTCSIGRAPDNELTLAGNEVSRRHAIIQAQGKERFEGFVEALARKMEFGPKLADVTGRAERKV